MNKLIKNDVSQLQQIIQEFSIAYDNKSTNIPDKLWIKQQVQREMPEMTDKQIEVFADDVLNIIQKHDENLKSVNDYCDKNGKKEQWLSDKISEVGNNVSMLEYGKYLSNIDEVIRQNNEAMLDTVFTSTGTINQGNNLHGFIAEQYHANTFNMNAALQGSNLRAEVLKPDGHGYAKNSVDIVIKDGSKIVERYQAKYYKDFEATAKAILHGDYRNQRVLTPLGQKEGVAELLPNKSVSDVIGGNKKTSGITSNPLSKEKALALEKAAQKDRKILRQSWNTYNTREIAYNISKQVVFASAGAIVITTGLDTAIKVMQGKKIKSSEVMKLAITTGADTGAKVATATALKIGAEKGFLSMIPKGISGFAVGTIACVAVENAKVAYKISTGQISATKGLDLMGRISCSTIGGLIGASEGGAGAVLAGLILTTNPIALSIVGITGLIAGSIAGSKIGEAVYSGIKTVSRAAKTVVSGAVKGIKSIGKSVVRGIRNIFC